MLLSLYNICGTSSDCSSIEIQHAVPIRHNLDRSNRLRSLLTVLHRAYFDPHLDLWIWDAKYAARMYDTVWVPSIRPRIPTDLKTSGVSSLS